MRLILSSRSWLLQSKRQRPAALQNLADELALKQTRQRFGVRLSSAALHSLRQYLAFSIGTRAFTLLEMLMVVAVISILASLLLPALAAAKAKGHTTTCKNNLRQMGHALAMYESDFGFLPGCGDCLIPTNNYPWTFPSTNSWLVRILPYVGPHADIFSCPDYQPHMNWNNTIKSDSFGYNAGGSSHIYVDMDKDLGLGFGKNWFIRSTALAAPSDMVELGDMQLPNSVWCNVISPWHKQPLGNVNCVVPSRHSNGANIVFCDGHVQWQTQARWIAENIPARSRWNNDHQPHPETW